jgi:hypothetical protein
LVLISRCPLTCDWFNIFWLFNNISSVYCIDLTRQHTGWTITSCGSLFLLLHLELNEEHFCLITSREVNWDGFHITIYALHLKFALCTHPFCPNLL